MLYLLEFLRKCAVRIRLKPEQAIGDSFVNYMVRETLEGRCKSVWFHVPNEGTHAKGALSGSILRNQGKWAGVSDYIFLGKNLLALEIKAKSGKLSPSQTIFKRWCADCDVPYEVAYSLDEAIDIVKKHGIVP